MLTQKDKDTLRYLISDEFKCKIKTILGEDKLPIDTIIDDVCEDFNIQREDLFGSKSRRKFALPRYLAMYIIHTNSKLLSISKAEITHLFNRSKSFRFSTAFDYIEWEMKNNSDVYNLHQSIIGKLKGFK